MSKKDKALKLALAVLKEWRKGFPDDWTDFDTEAVTAIEEALAEQPAQQRIDYRAECWPESPHYKPASLAKPAQQHEPVAWHDKIKGMEVSMDVSTGEDDAHNRIYGRVYEVILDDGEGTPNAILAIEEDRNFTSPPASKPWVGLTEEDVLRIKGQFKGTLDVQFDKFAYALDAKLREKNQ